MAYETIIYEKRDKIACITLNRPERLNAINYQMEAELRQAYAALEADDDVWVGIITGAGRALCAGADLNKFRGVIGDESELRDSGPEFPGSLAYWDAPQEASPPYLRMAKPLICAVNGVCVGAGLDLVTSTDIVICSEDSTFFDPHVSLGIVSARESVRMARVLPLNIALRMALMGRHERMDAQRAYQLGLVSEVVPRDELMDRAWEIAATVCLNAPLAVRGTRLSIRKGLGLPPYEAELLADGYRERVAKTEDAVEGARAFVEKRAPDWKLR